MATPLKIKDGSGNIQEMTTSDENYIAYQIGLHLAASDSAGDYGGINTDNSFTAVGTFTNTFFNEPVGTAPSTSITSGSTTSTIYQNQEQNALETDSDTLSPLMWVDSGGQTGFKQMPDLDLNDAVDRYLTTIFTNDYPGSYRLASSAPSGDYSVHLSNVFTDTRTDGTSVAYNIYQRDTMTAPTTSRPMFVEDSAGGSGLKIRAMNDRQIKYSFGQRAKNRIGGSKIGSYQLRSSAQGAPTDPGTWVARGTADDTKQTTADVSYSRSFETNYEANYVKGYDKIYSEVYSSLYSATVREEYYLKGYLGTFQDIRDSEIYVLGDGYQRTFSGETFFVRMYEGPGLIYSAQNQYIRVEPYQPGYGNLFPPFERAYQVSYTSDGPISYDAVNYGGNYTDSVFTDTNTYSGGYLGPAAQYSRLVNFAEEYTVSYAGQQTAYTIVEYGFYLRYYEGPVSNYGGFRTGFGGGAYIGVYGSEDYYAAGVRYAPGPAQDVGFAIGGVYISYLDAAYLGQALLFDTPKVYQSVYLGLDAGVDVEYTTNYTRQFGSIETAYTVGEVSYMNFYVGPVQDYTGTRTINYARLAYYVSGFYEGNYGNIAQYEAGDQPGTYYESGYTFYDQTFTGQYVAGLAFEGVYDGYQKEYGGRYVGPWGYDRITPYAAGAPKAVFPTGLQPGLYEADGYARLTYEDKQGLARAYLSQGYAYTGPSIPYESDFGAKYYARVYGTEYTGTGTYGPVVYMNPQYTRNYENTYTGPSYSADYEGTTFQALYSRLVSFGGGSGDIPDILYETNYTTIGQYALNEYITVYAKSYTSIGPVPYNSANYTSGYTGPLDTGYTSHQDVFNANFASYGDIYGQGEYALTGTVYDGQLLAGYERGTGNIYIPGNESKDYTITYTGPDSYVGSVFTSPAAFGVVYYGAPTNVYSDATPGAGGTVTPARYASTIVTYDSYVREGTTIGFAGYDRYFTPPDARDASNYTGPNLEERYLSEYATYLSYSVAFYGRDYIGASYEGSTTYTGPSLYSNLAYEVDYGGYIRSYLGTNTAYSRDFVNQIGLYTVSYLNELLNTNYTEHYATYIVPNGYSGPTYYLKNYTGTSSTVTFGSYSRITSFYDEGYSGGYLSNRLKYYGTEAISGYYTRVPGYTSLYGQPAEYVNAYDRTYNVAQVTYVSYTRSAGQQYDTGVTFAQDVGYDPGGDTYLSTSTYSRTFGTYIRAYTGSNYYIGGLQYERTFEQFYDQPYVLNLYSAGTNFYTSEKTYLRSQVVPSNYTGSGVAYDSGTYILASYVRSLGYLRQYATVGYFLGRPATVYYNRYYVKDNFYDIIYTGTFTGAATYATINYYDRYYTSPQQYEQALVYTAPTGTFAGLYENLNNPGYDNDQGYGKAYEGNLGIEFTQYYIPGVEYVGPGIYYTGVSFQNLAPDGYAGIFQQYLRTSYDLTSFYGGNIYYQRDYNLGQDYIGPGPGDGYNAANPVISKNYSTQYAGIAYGQIYSGAGQLGTPEGIYTGLGSPLDNYYTGAITSYYTGLDNYAQVYTSKSGTLDYTGPSLPDQMIFGGLYGIYSGPRYLGPGEVQYNAGGYYGGVYTRETQFYQSDVSFAGYTSVQKYDNENIPLGGTYSGPGPIGVYEGGTVYARNVYVGGPYLLYTSTFYTGANQNYDGHALRYTNIPLIYQRSGSTYVGDYTAASYEGAANYIGNTYIGYVISYDQSYTGLYYTSVYGEVQPAQDYTRTFEGSYSSANLFTATYTGSAIFARFKNYLGEQVQFTSQYSSGVNYTNVFDHPEYTRGFGADGTEYTSTIVLDYNTLYYVGQYTKEFSVAYTGDFIGDYTAIYSTDYLTDYLQEYTGSFEGETIEATDEVIETYTLYVRIA